MNEFGLRDMQMRSPYLVKNASVFEVLGATTIQGVMNHGDLSETDIEVLAESGRKFLVVWESHPEGWRDWLIYNSTDYLDNIWTVDVDGFTEFAAIVIDNYDFTIRDYREVRKYYNDPKTLANELNRVRANRK